MAEEQPRDEQGRFASSETGKVGVVRTVKVGRAKVKFVRRTPKKIDGDRLDLENYKQKDEHSCSFVAALTVAHHFDKLITPTDVLKVVRPTKDAGLTGKQLRDGLKKLGVNTEFKKDLTIDDLKAHVKAGRPVMLTVFPKDWTSDHWTVVEGFSGDRIHLSNHTSMPIAKFKEQWFDKGEGIICTLKANPSAAKQTTNVLPRSDDHEQERGRAAYSRGDPGRTEAAGRSGADGQRVARQDRESCTKESGGRRAREDQPAGPQTPGHVPGEPASLTNAKGDQPRDDRGRFTAVERTATPKVGYHTTDLANLKSIAKTGLKPFIPAFGTGGKGVYFADRPQYGSAGSKQDEHHEDDIALKVKIPKGHKAYDDPDVREYGGGQLGDRTKPRKDGPSAFYTTKAILPEHITVIEHDTGKETPLPEYIAKRQALAKTREGNKDAPGSGPAHDIAERDSAMAEKQSARADKPGATKQTIRLAAVYHDNARGSHAAAAAEAARQKNKTSEKVHMEKVRHHLAQKAKYQALITNADKPQCPT